MFSVLRNFHLDFFIQISAYVKYLVSSSPRLCDFLVLFPFCLVVLLLPPAFTFSFCLSFATSFFSSSEMAGPHSALNPTSSSLSLPFPVFPFNSAALFLHSHSCSFSRGQKQVRAVTGWPVPCAWFSLKAASSLQGWLCTCPLLW